MIYVLEIHQYCLSSRLSLNNLLKQNPAKNYWCFFLLILCTTSPETRILGWRFAHFSPLLYVTSSLRHVSLVFCVSVNTALCHAFKLSWRLLVRVRGVLVHDCTVLMTGGYQAHAFIHRAVIFPQRVLWSGPTLGNVSHKLWPQTTLNYMLGGEGSKFGAICSYIWSQNYVV